MARWASESETAPVKYEAKLIWNDFQKLSDGDKSCLAEMLNQNGSQQITTKHSPHGEFYQLLHSLGMAEPGTIDAELSEAGIEAWTLTSLGREKIPVCLVVGFAKADVMATQGKIMLRTLFRFLFAYAIVQLSAGLLAYGLTRLDVDISKTASFNVVIVTVLSCQAGLWFSLRTFRHEEGYELAKSYECLTMIAERPAQYAWAIMLAVFVFHLPFTLGNAVLLGEAISILPIIKAYGSAGIAALFYYFMLSHEVQSASRRLQNTTGDVRSAKSDFVQ